MKPTAVPSVFSWTKKRTQQSSDKSNRAIEPQPQCSQSHWNDLTNPYLWCSSGPQENETRGVISDIPQPISSTIPITSVSSLKRPSESNVDSSNKLPRLDLVCEPIVIAPDEPDALNQTSSKPLQDSRIHPGRIVHGPQNQNSEDNSSAIQSGIQDTRIYPGRLVHGPQNQNLGDNSNTIQSGIQDTRIYPGRLVHGPQNQNSGDNSNTIQSGIQDTRIHPGRIVHGPENQNSGDHKSSEQSGVLWKSEYQIKEEDEHEHELQATQERNDASTGLNSETFLPKLWVVNTVNLDIKDEMANSDEIKT